jgi:hypothetical protein
MRKYEKKQNRSHKRRVLQHDLIPPTLTVTSAESICQELVDSGLKILVLLGDSVFQFNVAVTRQKAQIIPIISMAYVNLHWHISCISLL